MKKEFLERLLGILNENQGVIIHVAIEKIPIELEMADGGNSLTVRCYGVSRIIGKPDGTFDALYEQLISLAKNSNQYFEKLGEMEWK